MKNKYILGAVIALLLAQYIQVGSLFYSSFKPNLARQFNQSTDQIKNDLEGKVVPIMFNQVWPFDSSQNITLDIVNKKQVDDYVVVVVDVKAMANVQPIDPASVIPKEQFSTNPTSKEPVKPAVPAPKLPSKVKLWGRMKLTYEKIENDWYLITVENLGLRALPID